MQPLTARTEPEDKPMRVLLMAATLAQVANLKALFVGADPSHVTLLEADEADASPGRAADVVLCDLGDLAGAGVDRVALLRRSMPSTPIVTVATALDSRTEADLRGAGATDVLLRGFLPSGPQAAPILVRLLEAAVARQEAANLTIARDQAERALLEANRDGVIVVAEDASVLAFNKVACDLLSRHPDDLRSGTFDVPRPIGVTNQLELRDESSQARRVLATASPVSWHGESGYLVMLREQREVATPVEGSMLLDSLTGLPGREFFLADLARQAKQANEDDSTFAVLLVDLDRFKVVNDWLGRAAGDEMLEAAARRILASVRPTDLVARVGGDQFAVLLRRLRHTGDAVLVGNRILHVLSRPFRLGGRELSTTASIGLVYDFGDILDVESLMAYAETGVERAKREGRNRLAVFDRALHDQRVHSLQRQAELRSAVEHGELRLVYQPVFDLTTNRIAGLEALVRWDHRVQGWLAPSEFIEVAEDSGLIVPLGEWVLAEACRQITEWKQWDPDLEVPPVSVNVSNRQLSHPQFLESFKRVTNDVLADGSRLCVEITESAVLENPKRTASIIQELRNNGVEVHLDDFGTGFSSLAHLQSLPISALKVDRSFVSQIPEHVQSTEIVRAVVALAHALGLTVIAEGVEEPEQKAELFKMGCDLAQGFYFARPMPAAEVFPMFQRATTGSLHRVRLGA